MVPSFQNVLLNQLNGPLTEQGPRKLGKMGTAAEAAHSGLPRRVLGEAWRLGWLLRPSPFSLLTLAQPGPGSPWIWWDLGAPDPGLLISDL